LQDENQEALKISSSRLKFAEEELLGDKWNVSVQNIKSWFRESGQFNHDETIAKFVTYQWFLHSQTHFQ
jgi:hypothetical protein